MQDNFVWSPWGTFVLPNRVCFSYSETFSGPEEITPGVQHAPGYSSIPARSFGWLWEKCPVTGPVVFESFPNDVESSKNSLYPSETPLRIGLKSEQSFSHSMYHKVVCSVNRKFVLKFSLCPYLLNQMADFRSKSSIRLESHETNFTGKSQRPLLRWHQFPKLNI